MLRLDFEWSFRPFLTVIRCIGVPLDHRFDPPLQEQGYLLRWNQCRNWVIVGFALLAFFLNILSQLSIISLLWISLTLAFRKNDISTTIFVTEFINVASNVTITVGGHLMALAFTLPNWPRLTKILHEMEDKRFICSADFKRFRSVCKTGLLILVIDVIVMILIMVLTIPPSPSLFHLLLHISLHLFPIYTLSHGFFFYSLCRVSHYMLQSLADQIKREAERQKTRSSKEKTSQWKSRLMSKWKDYYSCITEFIDEINNCFGHFILLATPCCFVRMINNSFNLVGWILLGYDSYESWLFGIHKTLFLIKDFIQLNMFAYTSHQIRQEAIRIAKHLRMLKFDDARLKSQVHFLKMEVYSSLPQITAVGLFDLNCGVVITFVSSTLTYMIILCQFQLSETKTFIHSNQTST